MKKIFILFIIIFMIVLIINLYIIFSTKDEILDIENIDVDNIDCILILGASMKDNYPSPMLEDRLLAGIELYEKGIASKILVSGDHENNDYDEVNGMKNYLIEKGVPSEDIFMDHAGLSSYDSIYRAKKIFKANRMVIVTQKYHLYRSLYIANSMDVIAYGVKANKRVYYGQIKRDIRECIARVKDFFKCIIMPTSKYLGEVVPITGNGDKTNDK